MFNIGLFSYHLPYLVLVLSYLTCWGYYSINKKDIEVDEVIIEYFESEKGGQETTLLYQNECAAKHSQFVAASFAYERSHFFQETNRKQIDDVSFVIKELKSRYLIPILSRPPPLEV